MIILKCPDCESEFHCIGDFTISEGRVFRVGNVASYNCERCSDIMSELEKHV